jgi:hypothetical protein
LEEDADLDRQIEEAEKKLEEVRKRAKNSRLCKSHQRVWDEKILKHLLPKVLNEEEDAGLYMELAYSHRMEAGLVGTVGLIRDLPMTEQLVVEPALEGGIPKHNFREDQIKDQIEEEIKEEHDEDTYIKMEDA